MNDAEVRERVRASGMTSISRAVSELVRAGLLKRHYQGYRVDHENRGAQRQAVYTIPPFVRGALRDKMALL
jgi:predicted transcriptional regulator